MQLSTSGITEIPAAEPPLLADLPQHSPRFTPGATKTAVLVRLTELATLVLTVR